MAKKKVVHELPEELVEEILLRLPVKSLLRFSSVSKSWKSNISESRFVKRYGVREKKIVITSKIHYEMNYLEKFTPSYHVSSLSASSSSATSTGVVVYDFGDKVQVLALCDGLWFACLYGHSLFPLFLWNPSTRRHKKLPNPSIMPYHSNVRLDFVYGLGYDSVADDYKILKIPDGSMLHSHGTELYSLRSDSWRDVPNFSGDIQFRYCRGGVFVSGNLHWLSTGLHRRIISFNISTEKFGEEIILPTRVKQGEIGTEVSVLKGMLCVSVNVDEKYIIWAMEDYGVASSWTIKVTIKKLDSISKIIPLHWYENGAILVQGFRSPWIKLLFIQHDEKSSLQQLNFGSSKVAVGIVYADSLVEPASFV